MKYTNKHNYPEYVYKWLATDDYDHNPDVVSATGLMKPARMIALSKKHHGELEIDVSDLVASRYGTALHDSFEALDLGEIQEQRFETTFFGTRISGKMDLVLDNVIRDFKSTSVWKYIKKEFDDYTRQLSIYRWLLHRCESHIPVAEWGQICFLFTDWQSGKAKHDPSYPQSRIATVDLALNPYDELEQWISNRLSAFKQAETELPECTPHELWETPTQYAVKKKGNKRAIKLYDSKGSALDALKTGQVIEERPGKVKRCNYCTCRPFCTQYEELKKQGKVEA